MNIYQNTTIDTPAITNAITPYVYKLTHKTTNQFYFGVRYANKVEPINDIMKKYFSSSDIIEKIIKEQGKDIFDVEIVFTNIDENICFNMEQKLIEEHWKNELSLNRNFQKAGGGFFKNVNPISDKTRIKISEAGRNRPSPSQETRDKISAIHKGKIVSEETRKKQSDAKKNISDETRAKMSLGRQGRIVTAETREKLSIASKNMTDETKQKISNTLKGRIVSDKTRAKMVESRKGRVIKDETREKLRAANLGKKYDIPRVFTEEHKANIGKSSKGRKHTEETKEKMSIAQSIKFACLYCNYTGNKSIINRDHNNNCKYKLQISSPSETTDK